MPRQEGDGWEVRGREDQEEPEGSAARAELVTLAWGTDTANRDSRRLMRKPFFFKIQIYLSLWAPQKNKLASQGQSSIRKAAGLALISVFGRVSPQFGG